MMLGLGLGSGFRSMVSIQVWDLVIMVIFDGDILTGVILTSYFISFF